MTLELFAEMASALGLTVERTDRTSRLTLVVLRSTSASPPERIRPFPKKIVRSGNNRNNFSIIIRT
jgi:hypothetical protein